MGNSHGVARCGWFRTLSRNLQQNCLAKVVTNHIKRLLFTWNFRAIYKVLPMLFQDLNKQDQWQIIQARNSTGSTVGWLLLSKWLRVLQTIQISYEYIFIQQDIGFSRTEFCHKSERASSSLIGKRMSTIQCLPTTRTIATQALHVAAYYGQPELVELLLEAGANPWHKNRCLSLLTLSLFRCASISWIQVVSKSLR